MVSTPVGAIVLLCAWLRHACHRPEHRSALLLGALGIALCLGGVVVQMALGDCDPSVAATKPGYYCPLPAGFNNNAVFHVCQR